MSTPFFILPDATAGDARDELFIGGDGLGALRVSASQFVRMQEEADALKMRNDELCKALMTVKYMCEQRAYPPSEVYKSLIEVAQDALRLT